MAKTLQEAAAEVLNKSRSSTPKEPMHKLDNTGSHLDGVVDLGGATLENPEGDETGKKTAAARPTATPPGVQPDAGKKEAMHKLDDGKGGGAETAHPGAKAAIAVSNQKAGEAESPEDHNGPHFDRSTRVKADYMHPTIHGEETETDEEDEIQEDEVLDDEILEDEITDEEIEEAKKERWENAKNKMKEMSCKEDVDAMFADETLSEEFKTRVATVFEAAVIARAVAVAESLEEEILEAAQEAMDDSYTEIEEQVDTYLNFVVENWVKENQVAIETGLRSEIVEDFISGLRNLFAENYIDIPADKVDVVETQAEEIAELQDQVNEVLNANAELTKKLNESIKTQILTTASEGLTATQAAKLKALTEGVEFTTEGEYIGKLNVIRESYFTPGKVKQDATSKVISLNESDPAEVEEGSTMTPGMGSLVEALKRTQNQ